AGLFCSEENMNVLNDKTIPAELRAAWFDSCPGQADAHEEGGFVLKRPDGSFYVERWPKGAQRQIYVPSHSGAMRGGLPIVATFHTHPNTGADYQQDPSPTDIQAVRDDPDLGGPEYEGEYVISEKMVYRILKDGSVEELGDTTALLGPAQ